MRLLRVNSVTRIKPAAAEIDEMSEAERASVADAVVELLRGQRVEDVLRTDAR